MGTASLAGPAWMKEVPGSSLPLDRNSTLVVLSKLALRDGTSMANIWRDYRHVAPRGADSGSREPFETWFQRIRDVIPHVPASVARDWLYLNWGGSPYDWLPLAQMRFEAMRCKNAEILSVGVGRGVGREAFLNWSRELGREGSHHRKIPLGQYMLEHRTWPVPILVLDSSTGLTPPPGETLARFHLVEGHMRLAFHHHLATSGQALDDHEVWLARIRKL